MSYLKHLKPYPQRHQKAYCQPQGMLSNKSLSVGPEPYKRLHKEIQWDILKLNRHKTVHQSVIDIEETNKVLSEMSSLQRYDKSTSYKRAFLDINVQEIHS